MAACVRKIAIGTPPVLVMGDAMATVLAHVMVDFKEMSVVSVKQTNSAWRAARNHASRVQPAPPTVVVWRTVLVNALEITQGQIAVSVFLVSWVKIVPRSAPALRMVIATQRGCASVTLGTAESFAILATVRLAKNAQ